MKMFNQQPEHNNLTSSSSHLGRLCDASNKADNFIQLRNQSIEQQQKYHQYHNQQSLASGEAIIKLSRLLLRLVNDTFLALPIEQCQTISIKPSPLPPEPQRAARASEGRRDNYDACSVDWSRTKVLNLESTISEEELEATPLDFLLVNSSSAGGSNKNFIRQQHNQCTGQNNTTNSSLTSPLDLQMSKPQLDYDLVKLTYLSLSSVLSILGIIINLFIILIIIFNTKQKRRSVIRNNNTSQNNLLLFQLTFTGILLASYVLLENLSISHSKQNEKDSLKLPPFTHNYCMARHAGPIDHTQPPAAHQWPLFNFLPPTPFHWQQSHSGLIQSSCEPQHVAPTSTTTSSNYNYQQFLGCACDRTRVSNGLGFKFHGAGGSDGAGNQDDEVDLQSNQLSFVLLLDFGPQASSLQVASSNHETRGRNETKHRSGPENGPRGPWNLEYYVEQQQQQQEKKQEGTKIKRKLIDLSGLLRSVSVAESSCRPIGWQGSEKKEKEAAQRDGSDSVGDASGGGGETQRLHPLGQQSSEQQNSETEYSSPADDAVLETNTSIQNDQNDDDGYSRSFWVLLLMELLPIFMNVIASIHIWTVAALAYDRYCAIAHPLQYLRSIHTSSRVRTFFIVSWAVSLLLNLLWPLSLNQIIDHQWNHHHHYHHRGKVAQSRENLGAADGCGSSWDGVELNLDQFTSMPQAGHYLPNVGADSDSDGSQSNSSAGESTIAGGADCSYCILSSLAMNSWYAQGCRKVSLVRLMDEIHHGHIKSEKIPRENTPTSVESQRNETNSMEAEQELLKMRNSLTIELTALLFGHQHYQQQQQQQQLSSSSSNSNERVRRPSNIANENGMRTTTTTTTTTTTRSDNGQEIWAGNLYIVLLVIYSLLGFLVIILAPLSVITICNIMIYRIVKVHERRLSFNSGSNVNTSASNLNYSHNYQIHSHYSAQSQSHNNNNYQQKQPRNYRRDLLDDRSETGSITSLLVARLIKVGLLRGGSNQQQQQHQEEIQNYCSDQDINQSCSLSITNNCNNDNNNKPCDCDRNSSMRFDYQDDNNKIQEQPSQTHKTPGNNPQPSTIVNRSKRVIIRQNSYQILAKLKAGGTTEAGATNSHLCQSFSGAEQQHRPTSGGGGGFPEPAHKQVGTCPLGHPSCHAPSTLSLAHHHQYQGPSRVKRKASDHTIRDFNPNRKDSNTSQLSDYRSDLNGNNDNLSLFNDCSPSVANNNSEVNSGKMYHESSSGGIINQLKLAGLSFAGIAIQGSPASAFSGFKFGKPTLQKSSSCSLGNLNVGQNHHNQTFSVSRCSMETSSSIHTCPKGKSYVSLNSPNKQQQQQQQQDTGNNKSHLARLLDDGSDSPQLYQAGPHHFNYNSPRLPFTLGTKSLAFNVLVWLILSLLIFTLPHYLIVTINQIRSLKAPNTRNVNLEQAVDLEQSYQELMGALVESISLVKNYIEDNSDADDKLSCAQTITENGKAFKPLDYYHDRLRLMQIDDGTTHYSKTLWETSSIWLSCLSRILFLSMVPLNGWLYGIRSRSLRATLRIVLKRYISRRQASIEINQRQRSISSIRSRDSSFVNLPQLYYSHNSSVCASCNYRMPIGSPQRMFRRCSSFSGSKRDNEMLRCNNNSSSSQPFTMNAGGETKSTEETKLVDDTSIQEQTQAQAIKSTAGPNGNTIRFLIGDCSSDRDFGDSTMTPIALNQQATANLGSYNNTNSQNTSPVMSLAGSHRSLMSASIHSANSILFDDARRSQEYSWDSSSNHQKSSIKRSVGITSPTSVASDTPSLGKGASGELDHRLKNILISGQNYGSTIIHGKISSDFSEGTGSRATFDSILVDSGNSTEPGKQSEGGPGNAKEQFDNKCHSNESPNEFRFFLTPADRRQHVVELSNGEANLAPRRDTVIDLHGSGRAHAKLVRSAHVDEQVSHNWWRELKVNLSKIVHNTSARLLPQDLIDDERRADSKYYGTRSQWLESSDQSIEAENQCRRALLRKSSFDGQSSKWNQNSLVDRLNLVSSANTSNKRKRKKNRLRASLTLNNINSIVNNEFGTFKRIQYPNHKSKSIHNKNNYRDCNGSTKKLDHSSTYLKPPNFLKLIFEQNNHSNPYSGTSALSPIKECNSSNHSYVSSQSSLNTNNHQLVTHPTRTLSMGKLSNMVDPTATTVAENS